MIQLFFIFDTGMIHVKFCASIGYYTDLYSIIKRVKMLRLVRICQCRNNLAILQIVFNVQMLSIFKYSVFALRIDIQRD